MKKHTPLETRLARAVRRSDLRRLQDYGAPHAASAWFAANENEVGSTQVDRIVEIRPSPDEMVRLAVQDAIAARVGYGPITAREMDAPMRARLRLDATGQIAEWRGSDNRWHDAAELFRQPKGGRRKTDEERQADNQRHLSIRASGEFPAASAYCELGNEGEDYRRMRAARWAQTLCACNDNRRVELDRAGLGGRHAFAAARSNAGLAPAERYPTGIAMGAEFMGYRQHRSVTATPGSFVGPASGPEDALIAALDAPHVKTGLGEHFAVLEASLDGLTARQIADTKGWGLGKVGERKAVAAQDLALEALAAMEKKLAG
ncbi:hypothetical protein [Bradyrhizobium sp. CCGB20]|uniref:hypothetical protein n=1 Tax=Bradyrhizobium sp. CCGB20 TaxID=2949633 RepID=UPI0020B1FF86|nr:hypothetical protein [Bradyrhizobium sp. CCGB20]MCP3400244.1 hypothetical protein [Bradyrhizobium sp. CCGB20]